MSHHRIDDLKRRAEALGFEFQPDEENPAWGKLITPAKIMPYYPIEDIEREIDKAERAA